MIFVDTKMQIKSCASRWPSSMTRNCVIRLPNTKVHPGKYAYESTCIMFYWVQFAYFALYDDVIKWKHFRVTGPLRGIPPPGPVVNSPHKSQWDGASTFSLICAWTNGWVNNGEKVIWDTIALWRHCNDILLWLNFWPFTESNRSNIDFKKKY